MLKIKDNVDLKELEKFGFIKNLRKQRYERNFNGFLGRTENTHINTNTREIEVFIKSIMGINNIDDLFQLSYFTHNEDIVKADLVEKVGE